MKVALYDYIDINLKILIIIYLADLLQRLFLAWREYFSYWNHYENKSKLNKIFKYAFAYTNCTTVLIVVTAFVTLWHTNSNQSFLIELLAWLKHMPIYWILSWVRFNHCTLDYAYWIREEHSLDYGAGMASSFFHGYLKLTMPSNKEHPGIRQRIADYAARQKVEFAVNRLIILVPDIMYVDPKIEGKYLEKVGALTAIRINRAGVEREYKNDVYRITIPIDGTFYYVALEGATPMLSFFESMNFKLSSTWQMRAMKKEIFIKFTKHLKKLLMKWPETEQECEVLPYSSYTDDGRKADASEIVLGHIFNLRSKGRA